jgi:hypothetical protein
MRSILIVITLLTFTRVAVADETRRPFEIRVLDQETGRGVPLVELETVHNVRYITDSAGRIAYDEPGHDGETIYFEIHAHGYRVPKDGFGFPGVRFDVKPGGKGEVKLERVNLAERLYRITGQDIYRDTVLLGEKAPIREPYGAGKVSGQDSVLGVPYRGKLFWFWGDTNRLSYPLGLFRTAGATSELPANGGLDPAVGIDLTYFTGKDGFARNMIEVKDQKGVVWMFGITTVPDDEGRERLVGHYARREGLGKVFEQGIAIYNDERELFEPASAIPVEDEWRFLHDHPAKVEESGTTWLMSGTPFPVTRVKASLAEVLKPESYQGWSCVDPKTGELERDDAGKLKWGWRSGPPVTQKDEVGWLKAKKVKPEELWFLPEDSSKSGRRLTPHTGGVQWNAHRRKWVMIASEISMEKESPSMLGEIWYSEADSPQGPFRKAVKVLSHDKQSFYNPCHHPFFDADGGRTIYFEGTYTNSFTNAAPTQRYNYNQMMYRLDLAHPELTKVFGKPALAQE